MLIAEPNSRHRLRKGRSENPSIGARMRSPRIAKGPTWKRTGRGSMGDGYTAFRRRIPRARGFPGSKASPTIVGRMWHIIGHEWAEALLRRHLESNGVRHAYLFTGPAGVGKRTLA